MEGTRRRGTKSGAGIAGRSGSIRPGPKPMQRAQAPDAQLDSDHSDRFLHHPAPGRGAGAGLGRHRHGGAPDALFEDRRLSPVRVNRGRFDFGLLVPVLALKYELTLTARACKARCWRMERAWSAGGGNGRDRACAVLEPYTEFPIL